jgi:hypothetical protein
MSNEKLIPVYTVSKVDKECNQYGKKHWSNDGEITFCGKALNESWFIINNTVDGQADCKVCRGLTSYFPPAEDDKLKHIQKQNAELRELTSLFAHALEARGGCMCGHDFQEGLCTTCKARKFITSECLKPTKGGE